MPGESPPTRKMPSAQGDSGLRPEDLVKLVEHGGRGLIQNTGVAGRTRRRMLARSGTSLHEVRRAARRALAEALLASSLPLKEIAKRLGYSSTQTLSRLVRQEFGKTPSELREELQRE